ncbi:regulator of chromosome condensation, RCC1 [Roseibium sp. TrichSKD4]|uniref:RCC1 domain-containing protein n=1 Tax=Roseibium sp. TrichSKD4 TaxID=744980 RepID=UPI0001E56379|nr:regulator of chromosome condensation RCC1 [Roseibium sp. TrichSKD4]EFO33891.1 regulator of chromosome condensation, RCC1 [Roseibium sp. TrichSKD4]
MKLDLNKIKFTWRGEYDTATEYEADDIVSLDGSTYICVALEAVTGIAPVEWANTTTWHLYNRGLSAAERQSSLNAAGNRVAKLTDGKAMYGRYRSGGVIMEDGTLRLWGDSGSGQLGQGTWHHHRSTPITPAFPKTDATVAKWVTSGRENLCLMSDGSVYVWGQNGYGCLGVGNTSNVHVPTRVTALDGVNIIDISVGQSRYTGSIHVMFLADDGRLFASGYNAYGQLGLGNTTSVSTPTALAKDDWSQVVCVGSNYGRTFAIDENGGLFAWGYNSQGPLGLGNSNNRSAPEQVTLPDKCVEIVGCMDDNHSTGDQPYGHTLARLEDGRVYSWGYNGYGQLGTGNTSTVHSPQHIAALGTDNEQLLAWGGAYGSSAVVKADGTIRTFGYNNYGQLGLGNTSNTNSPQNPGIEGNGGIKQVLGYGGYNYASLAVLHNDGTLLTTGYNGNGQLGVGHTSHRSSFTPVHIMKHKPVALCAVGYVNETGMGILTDNGLYYQTGYGGHAQIPDDDHEPSCVPYLVQFQ